MLRFLLIVGALASFQVQPPLEREARAQAAAQASLVGTWRIEDKAVKFDGLEIRTTGMRVTYHDDGSSQSSGVIHLSGTIDGETIPPGAITFGMRLRTKWELQGTVLREEVETASIEPRPDLPETRDFAELLRTMYQGHGPFTGDLTLVAPDRVQVRERLTGEVITMVRSRP